jgi:RNA polymerase sigma factor (sigma-70 family)
MVVATESEVVSRARSGDRAAFGILYDTYLPKIYDFALGMLRNRADAEDVTSETFLKCVERLGTLKDPEAFRGWLYTIARNSALSLIESRKRAVPTAEHDEEATVAATGQAMPDPEARAESDELRDLVWDAAATLNRRDYQVFELTVRHGLSSAEIAPILDVRPAYAYILVNRLKGSVEEALEAVLLTRTGRTECAALDRLVDVYGSEATPRLRKAVARHANDCAACGQTKRTKASVPALLAGTAFAAPSAAFAAELSAKIDRAWPPTAPPGGGGSGMGGSALSNLVGAGLIVAALSIGTIGATAQRTLDPNDDIAEVAPAVEEKDVSEPKKEKDEPPPPEREPSAPQRPSDPDPGPQPQNTPIVVVVDGSSGDQGDVEVSNESDDEPPPTEPTDPPVEDPPPKRPPKQPPVG